MALLTASVDILDLDRFYLLSLGRGGGVYFQFLAVASRRSEESAGDEGLDPRLGSRFVLRHESHALALDVGFHIVDAVYGAEDFVDSGDALLAANVRPLHLHIGRERGRRNQAGQSRHHSDKQLTHRISPCECTKKATHLQDITNEAPIQ